jgi:hypothetical protein
VAIVERRVQLAFGEDQIVDGNAGIVGGADFLDNQDLLKVGNQYLLSTVFVFKNN